MLDTCDERGLTVPEVNDSQSLTGRGIQGRVEGRLLALGNRRLLEEQGLDGGALLESATAWEAQGRTLSWLLELQPEVRVIGLFAFGDSLRTVPATPCRPCGNATSPAT